MIGILGGGGAGGGPVGVGALRTCAPCVNAAVVDGLLGCGIRGAAVALGADEPEVVAKLRALKLVLLPPSRLFLLRLLLRLLQTENYSSMRCSAILSCEL